MISEFNGATNVIALVVIALGVALSFTQPGAGHDLIIGGLGALGGATWARRGAANQIPNDPPQQ
jgi:hypothetical protein